MKRLAIVRRSAVRGLGFSALEEEEEEQVRNKIRRFEKEAMHTPLTRSMAII